MKNSTHYARRANYSRKAANGCGPMWPDTARVWRSRARQLIKLGRMAQKLEAAS